MDSQGCRSSKRPLLVYNLWSIKSGSSVYCELHGHWDHCLSLLLLWLEPTYSCLMPNHGLVGSSAKTGNFLSIESHEWKTCTYLGSNIKVPFGMGHPHLHLKPSLYMCRRAQGSQIFKQDSIISICSCFIVFLRFGLLWLQAGRSGEWGYLG